MSCRFFTASHETLIWARKDKKTKHTFNYEAIKNWKDNYKKEIQCSFCHKKDKYEILHEKGNQMRSVWRLGKRGLKRSRVLIISCCKKLWLI